MGKKVFVSYKYGDTNVEILENNNGFLPIRTTVRTYVDKLEEIIGRNDIYKGENDGEDLSDFTDETIWTNLKQKIFDSSITIVLISPRMKEWTDQKEQWIPQEISYSLKNITHDSRTSKTNALICVVLPDSFGRYTYYINDGFWGATYNDNVTFDIIKNNRNNKKSEQGDYIITVKWKDFIEDYSKYINEAIKHQENIDDYNITKII